MVEDTEIAYSQNKFMTKTSVLIMGAIPVNTHRENGTTKDAVYREVILFTDGAPFAKKRGRVTPLVIDF